MRKALNKIKIKFKQMRRKIDVSVTIFAIQLTIIFKS